MSAKIPIALGFLFILTLASPAFADSQSNNLSLALTGAVLSAGSQTYSIQGGQLVSAAVPNHAFDHSSHIDYSLNAVVNGLSVSGSASFDITSVTSGGTHVEVHGEASIIGDASAVGLLSVYFPLTGTCTTDCPPPSEIPSGFLGLADITVSTCHGAFAAQKCTTTPYSGVGMIFESSYLNPFGGPIFFGSTDNSFFVVATYTTSRVTWTGVQLGGTLLGSLAGSPVSGSFGMTVNSVEDLRAGYELDHGTISFLTDTPAVTGSGSFLGLSIIPKVGSACPPGFPPGTCLITGLGSSGVFSQTNSLGGSVFGRYSTTWNAPAITFSSSVSAIVKQSGK